MTTSHHTARPAPVGGDSDVDSPRHEGGLRERANELAAIEGAFARAHEGEGSIRMFEGEPGVGKTALLEAAGAIGAALGVQALAATCRPQERDLSYGVVLQLFEQRLVQAPPEEREHLLAGAAEPAGPLLLGDQGPPKPHEPHDLSIDHGLYWLCSNLAENGPLALIVDDTRWADPATLQFFTYLAQRLRGLPVVLILGCRSADSLGLRELAAHPATERFQLDPLTPLAVCGILRESLVGQVDEGFADACHHATGGNPFLLRKLTSELGARAIAPTSEAAADVATIAPGSITNSVLLRLRGLGDAALALAPAVAVLGGDAEVRHAAALAQIPQPEATEVADSLIEAGILASGETLSFRHPIVQSAVYRERSEPQQAEAHRQAALMLHSQHAAPDKVAGQLLSAATAGDRVVVDVLLALATQATSEGDPDSAARLLERALREPPEPDQRPLVVLALGRAEAKLASPQAVDRFTRALELTEEPETRASVALEVSQLLVNLGRPEESLAALEGALAEAESWQRAQRALLEAGVAATRRLLGRKDSAWTRVPVDVPQDAADTLAWTAQLAYEAALEGRPVDEVSELAGRALAGGALLKEETADGMSTYLAAVALTMVEDFPAAEVVLDGAVEDARRRGSLLGYASASCYRGIALLSHGRLEEAAADLENCLAGQRYGWALALPGAHAALAECHIERGDLGAAERTLNLGDETGPGSEALGRWRLLAVRGHLRLVTGRYREAFDDLTEGGRRQELMGAVNPAVFPWRSLAAVAMAGLGDQAEAVRLAEEELQRARAFGAPGAIGNALRALGTVSDTRDALGTLEEAVRVLDRSGAELRRAQAYVDFGSALRRTGRRRDARAPLLEGLSLSGRCGARSLARRAHSELIASGGRPRRPSARGLDTLTPREHQTATLAASGLSNRAIAESMFVTLKTVEWHLGNTYDKLGLSSRAELESILSTENV